MRRGRLLVCLIVVLLASFQPLGYVSAQQQGAGPSAVYFPLSGHHLDNRYGFLDYWRTHGQVTRFGFPVTEVLEEDGRPVQYFERARMEYHEEIAEGDKVLLGLLGRERTDGRNFEKGATGKGRFFPETGYTVTGEFLQFWTKRGGLADFGYPLSESFVEKQPDGSERLVQWFERARLEYHIENVHPFFIERAKANKTSVLTLYEVLMGQLGREIAIQHEISVAPFPRRAGVPDWSPALWPQRIDVDLTKQRITAYEGNLQVFSAGVSTGKNGFETPPGTYYVYAKLLYDDMTGNAQGEEYDVRKVPFVQYFTRGFAIHGTYWHNQFGTGVRRSHGCVNLSMDDAEWLWLWSQPAFDEKKAGRVASYKPLQPQTKTEAQLQPQEGLAIFRRGTTVVVHR